MDQTVLAIGVGMQQHLFDFALQRENVYLKWRRKAFERRCDVEHWAELDEYMLGLAEHQGQEVDDVGLAIMEQKNLAAAMVASGGIDKDGGLLGWGE